MRRARAGEPYGALALPPRSRMPFWLALARVAPLVVALSTLMPWGTAHCTFLPCLSQAQTLYPLVAPYPQYPWILTWGWGLLVSALLVLSSLGFTSSSTRTVLRATGVVLGAVSLALPLSMASGVFLDRAGIFVVRAAPGLWISALAFLVMSVASFKA